MRLLLVEDSVALVDELMPVLKRAGFVVDWLADGRDAERRAFDETFDIVILDLGLPGRPGLEVLRAWRAQRLAVPVLVLTARDSWRERIEGLKAGADDYLTKPFHPDELVLRLQAVLRRAHGSVNEALLEVGDLALDEQRQCVRRKVPGADGVETIALTGAEFRLLRYLMLHAGKLRTRSQIEEHVYDTASERDSNVIEVHVNKLRRKLGRDAIETRRGQGYVFRGEAR